MPNAHPPGSPPTPVRASAFALAGIPLAFLAGFLSARRIVTGKPGPGPAKDPVDGDASLRELAESRARIQLAFDIERRQIERDLHDGIQQRLIALGIRIGLAQDLFRGDTRVAALLGELGTQAEEALHEIRALAQDVYPSLLVDEGLVGALHALARGASLPTTVVDLGIGSYPPEVESAVYFSCVEALENAAKHARGATSVTITITAADDGALSFEVRDDGPGFEVADVKPGTGLLNMHDRIGAAGGNLVVYAEAGEGTRVIGIIGPREPGLPDAGIGAAAQGGVAVGEPVEAMSRRAGLSVP